MAEPKCTKCDVTLEFQMQLFDGSKVYICPECDAGFNIAEDVDAKGALDDPTVVDCPASDCNGQATKTNELKICSTCRNRIINTNSLFKFDDK